ncbi:MAG: hypothetical protein HY718_14525, partial [Planctomycetes bacterium]|nr:hypothetical protein [Planctomycetota bacterium]
HGSSTVYFTGAGGSTLDGLPATFDMDGGSAYRFYNLTIAGGTAAGPVRMDAAVGLTNMEILNNLTLSDTASIDGSGAVPPNPGGGNLYNLVVGHLRMGGANRLFAATNLAPLGFTWDCQAGAVFDVDLAAGLVRIGKNLAPAGTCTFKGPGANNFFDLHITDTATLFMSTGPAQFRVRTIGATRGTLTMEGNLDCGLFPTGIANLISMEGTWNSPGPGVFKQGQSICDFTTSNGLGVPAHLSTVGALMPNALTRFHRVHISGLFDAQARQNYEVEYEWKANTDNFDANDAFTLVATFVNDAVVNALAPPGVAPVIRGLARSSFYNLTMANGPNTLQIDGADKTDFRVKNLLLLNGPLKCNSVDALNPNVITINSTLTNNSNILPGTASRFEFFKTPTGGACSITGANPVAFDDLTVLDTHPAFYGGGAGATTLTCNLSNLVPSLKVLTVSGNIDIAAASTLVINRLNTFKLLNAGSTQTIQGILQMEQFSTLLLDTNLTLAFGTLQPPGSAHGAKFVVNGIEGEDVIIDSVDQVTPGRYAFQVFGTINAKFFKFIRMKASGIELWGNILSLEAGTFDRGVSTNKSTTAVDPATAADPYNANATLVRLECQNLVLTAIGTLEARNCRFLNSDGLVDPPYNVTRTTNDNDILPNGPTVFTFRNWVGILGGEGNDREVDNTVLTADANIGNTTMTVLDARTFVNAAAQSVIMDPGGINKTVQYSFLTDNLLPTFDTLLAVPAAGPNSIDQLYPTGTTVEAGPDNIAWLITIDRFSLASDSGESSLNATNVPTGTPARLKIFAHDNLNKIIPEYQPASGIQVSLDDDDNAVTTFANRTAFFFDRLFGRDGLVPFEYVWSRNGADLPTPREGAGAAMVDLFAAGKGIYLVGGRREPLFAKLNGAIVHTRLLTDIDQSFNTPGPAQFDVLSAAGLPAAGTINIGGDEIAYTITSGNTLQGVSGIDAKHYR